MLHSCLKLYVVPRYKVFFWAGASETFTACLTNLTNDHNLLLESCFFREVKTDPEDSPPPSWIEPIQRRGVEPIISNQWIICFKPTQVKFVQIGTVLNRKQNFENPDNDILIYISMIQSQNILPIPVMNLYMLDHFMGILHGKIWTLTKQTKNPDFFAASRSGCLLHTKKKRCGRRVFVAIRGGGVEYDITLPYLRYLPPHKK